VLMPHAKDAPPAALAARVTFVESVPEGAGMAVRIDAGGTPITIGVKQDLRQDIARDYRRPRYLFEKGRIQYGAIETDGDLLFAKEAGGELSYTIVNMTRAVRGAQVLFQNGQSFHGLPFDASNEVGGTDKVRYWRDTVRIGGTRN
jgi:hypothetical protein